MKKQILFVIPSLRSGGAEKSLITLLSLFDYEKYDVDLLAFRSDGLFFEKLPEKINVIKDTKTYEIFDGDTRAAIKYFLKKGNISSLIDKIKFIKTYKDKDPYLKEKTQWSLLKKQLPPLSKKYDCAIGYLEGNASYYVSEYPFADKKIVYVHSDFIKLGYGKKISAELFGKIDNVVTVSKQCYNTLCEVFPEYKNKFCVVENITSPSMLKKFSEEAEVYNRNNDEKILLTVGRFSPPKGIDTAVKTCAELKARKCDFKWYHIGAGPLEEEIKALIKELEVENDFILLGEKSNPYPYIAQCDIYVQTSNYEGKSIAVDEAKCLCKPIVVTDFSTVFDQIQNDYDGIICKMNEKSIADGIVKLFNDNELCKKLQDNLSKEKCGNEFEINKLYKLIEG